MIEIKNISKSFGSLQALDNVSATISEGHVFGLIGTNGAGKSTLINVLSAFSISPCIVGSSICSSFSN